MIPKVTSRTETARFIRSSLQKTSPLKNLNTSMVREPIRYPHNMVIPGGMTQKEEFVYKLTGKFPKSVTDRWHEIHLSDHISSDDDVVSVTQQTLADTGYVNEFGSGYADTGHSDHESLLNKIAKLFIDTDS